MPFDRFDLDARAFAQRPGVLKGTRCRTYKDGSKVNASAMPTRFNKALLQLF